MFMDSESTQFKNYEKLYCAGSRRGAPPLDNNLSIISREVKLMEIHKEIIMYHLGFG